MSEEKKIRKWGIPFSIVALVFGILAMVCGLFALIPLLGLVFAVVTGVFALIAIATGIPGVIGSEAKGRAITALVFGGLMLIWAIVRYYWVFLAAASVGV